MIKKSSFKRGLKAGFYDFPKEALKELTDLDYSRENVPPEEVIKKHLGENYSVDDRKSYKTGTAISFIPGVIETMFLAPPALVIGLIKKGQKVKRILT